MSFQNGDRVTGVPSNWMRRQKTPTVTGYYDLHKYEIEGNEFSTEFVMVGEIPVDCTKIRKADRREKDTVLS